MPDEKLTKSELVAAIRTERTRLENALANFSEAQKTEVISENGWRIKDLMAHIPAWEWVGFDIVQAARDSEALKPYIAKAFESVDDFNAQIYEKNKYKTLREIEAEFKAAHQNFFGLIGLLGEAFIVSKLPFDGAEELSVQFIISATTHIHYQEHAETLEVLLNPKN